MHLFILEENSWIICFLYIFLKDHVILCYDDLKMHQKIIYNIYLSLYIFLKEV